MNYFLGTDFLYGYELVKSYVMQMGEAKFWEHTHTVKFPKVTMCDLTVRRLGNVQRYTVQCVLPVNIFTEKIYLFIYFWFILISFRNIVSLVLWVGELTLRCDRQRYVSSHLCRIERLHAGDKSLCSTLYVQRSGKSVELRLSVPGSWAVIVVELWGSVANKHTGLLKNDSLYSKTHHSLNSKYTVNRLDSVSTWIESELNQNEIKLMNHCDNLWTQG